MMKSVPSVACCWTPRSAPSFRIASNVEAARVEQRNRLGQAGYRHGDQWYSGSEEAIRRSPPTILAEQLEAFVDLRDVSVPEKKRRETRV